MLNNIFFYLPMGYLLKTRLNSLAKFISWNIIYVFPLFYLAYIKLNFVITIIDFVEILGSIIVVYNFYEIGYIQNDTETIKRESNPTLRVSKDELEYYEENKWYIYIARIVINCIFVYFLFYLSDINSLLYFEFLLHLLLLLFIFYNLIRNRMSILLYFLLIILRYIIPLIMIGSSWNINLLVVLILMLPLCKTMEFLSKKKYGFKFCIKYVRSNLTSYRVCYYTLVLVLISLLIWGKVIPIYYFFLFFYFWAYRLFIYILHKSHMTPRDYLS